MTKHLNKHIRSHSLLMKMITQTLKDIGKLLLVRFFISTKSLRGVNSK